MIVHMCKLQMVTLDEQFDRLIEGLQQLGYLHLEPVPLSDPQAAGALHRMQLTEADQQRRLVLAEARRNIEELRAALGELPAPYAAEVVAAETGTGTGHPDRSQLHFRGAEEIRDAAAELLGRVRSLRRRQRNLEQDGRILRRYLRVGHLVPPAGHDADDAHVLLFTFPSAERIVAKTLRQRLRTMAPPPQLRFYRVEGGNSVAAVVCPGPCADGVRQAAWQAGTLEFKLPSAYRSEHLADSIRRVQADVDSLPQRLAELDRELDRFRRQAGQYAAALDQQCAEEAQRLEAKTSFIEGVLLRVLHAFLPVDKKDDVVGVANELTGGRVEIAELSVGPRLEDVPVVLHNPSFAKPFELLLRIFPPPTYGTFDPTLVNAIGVPFFFGLIVGDVAYGAVILGVALWLRWRYRQREMLRAIGTIGVYCAASSMLFGLLYGELFGSLGVRLGLHPVIHREQPEDLLWLLKLAVAIGAMHVGLGLCFGMLTARQVLDRHAFHERLGQLLCLMSAVLLTAALFLGGVWWLAASGTCLTAGVAVLLWGAGVVGLLEVFSLFSNILSYSRLMALGTASVVLALVANRIFAKLDYGVTGLFAAAMLHALNILIAMFSPTIHTLRLHYVEFFTKFYRPEGRDFVAFGARPESWEQE